MFGPEKVLKSEKGLLISTNYFWTGPRIKKEWDHLPATFCLQPQADYYTSDEVECNAGKNLWVSVKHHQGMNKRILWWHHSFIWIEYCDYIEIVTDLGIIVGDSLRDSTCNIACQDYIFICDARMQAGISVNNSIMKKTCFKVIILNKFYLFGETFMVQQRIYVVLELFVRTNKLMMLKSEVIMRPPHEARWPSWVFQGILAINIWCGRERKTWVIL